MAPRVSNLPSFVCTCVVVNSHKLKVDEAAAQEQVGGRATLPSCGGRVNRRTGVRERSTEVENSEDKKWSYYFSGATRTGRGVRGACTVGEREVDERG